jgi:hypothetical protein
MDTALKTCDECRLKVLKWNQTSCAPRVEREAACLAFYNDMRRSATCTHCGLCDEVCMQFCRRDPMDNTPALSRASHWAAESRGIDALTAASERFFACCPFCKSIHHTKECALTAFDDWLNARYLASGKHCDCNRVLTMDTIRGFQFAHWDAACKTFGMYELRSQVREGLLTEAEAKRRAEEEWRHGRVICANCHHHETLARSKRHIWTGDGTTSVPTVAARVNPRPACPEVKEVRPRLV